MYTETGSKTKIEIHDRSRISSNSIIIVEILRARPSLCIVIHKCTCIKIGKSVLRDKFRRCVTEIQVVTTYVMFTSSVINRLRLEARIYRTSFVSRVVRLHKVHNVYVGTLSSSSSSSS